MTWMLPRRAGWIVLTLLLAGCQGGAMGPGTSYRTVPPARTGTETRPPIARPMLAPGATASSVQVLPFSTLPPHATLQAQNRGAGPLAMLAANNPTLDGRSMPFLDPSASMASAAASSNEDLKYRGGRTIRDLTWINIYVGGQAAWDSQDWRSIDKSLLAAMTDENLNNIIRQYFNNAPLKNTFKGSFFLAGWRPQTVSKSDLERQVSGLYSSGAFQGMDLSNTVVNFMLPRGTILGDPLADMAEAPAANSGIPGGQAEDSTAGLGGYHGSVHVSGATVYYAVGVYSERLPNGGTNGIPVFDQNWKNVVATLYHQLQEARTDPDVGDALAGLGPDPARWLGWTSDSGHEIGDFPLTAATQLSTVFREVPLANGSGTVPIQLLYSNAVHGPEGPPAGTNPPPSNPPSNNQPPPISDPDLEKLISAWGELEDFVKKAILRLANTQ